MQYILTQQEYDKLLTRSDERAKQTINMIRSNNIKLRVELQELKDKYTKLFVFGVTTNNEKLKDSKCKALS